ncbi:MAG TPA: shikimate kinase [Planctomycetota bacterium]|nr:shikimate kinase [Planctomycetota bacterium]
MKSRDDSRTVRPLPWPCDAELTLPGAKSEANRVLVAAALCGRAVTVTGATPSDDVRHLVGGLRALGFAAHWLDESRGIVQVGPRAEPLPAAAELFCGNAGTALRFLVSVAAITPGTWTITGDAGMQRRPIGALVDAWCRLGVAIEATNGCPPVRVAGAAVTGGRVMLDASISSQFVSSLLLVGAQLPAGLDIAFTGPIASAPYAQLTCDVLHRFGVPATLRPDGASVRSGDGTAPAEFAVHGDWSAMGVWTCLEFLTGSHVRARNLRAGSGQPDEHLADTLRGLDGAGDRSLDVAALPDQFLNLAIVAALRPGTTQLVGAANLRHKECDRLAVMARELRRVGVTVHELPDGLAIDGARSLHAARIDPAADHRVAMAFALLGLVSAGITIADPDCVTKSYPAFWHDVQTVHDSLRCVAVVGMRGAGKSTFARALAERAGCTWVDTDEHFEAQFGPIARFVAEHGWPAFRREEARLVAASLAPARVVSTGGGAIEHPATRALLAARTLVIWLDGEADLLRARLRLDARPRPSVTGADPALEIDELLARREPLYAAAANARLDAALPTALQIERALPLLRANRRRP